MILIVGFVAERHFRKRRERRINELLTLEES